MKIKLHKATHEDIDYDYALFEGPHIVGVFETEAEARAYLKRHGLSHCHIELYDKATVVEQKNLSVK